jgi:hypothetical protein
MAPESKGDYNRAPIFNEENYSYWKDCMRVHIISYDREVWNVVVNSPFVPKTTNVVGVEVLKPENEWTSDDENKMAYDWKERNILISALEVDEYYRISHCITAKAMWDAFEVAHEGAADVKQSKININ